MSPDYLRGQRDTSAPSRYHLSGVDDRLAALSNSKHGRRACDASGLGIKPDVTWQQLTSAPLPGLPKMLVIRNYFGVPIPASGPALSIQTGDIIELLCADVHSPWWQVRAPAAATSHQPGSECI